MNEAAFNFENLIDRLILEDNFRSNRTHICDYQFNDTHKVIDLVFIDISYSNKNHQLDTSLFYNVKVYFSFTISNEKLEIGHDKGLVLFKHIQFGEQFIYFAMYPKIKHYLINKVTNIIRNIEKKENGLIIF